MKNIKTLLIILIAALFFTACQKDEMPENYDTISGVLIAGENVGAQDLSEITLYLAKLHDGIDPMLVTTETEELDLVEEVALNVDGSFAFTQLQMGNYVIALSGNYMFSTDTFLIVPINGTEIESFQKTIKRIEEENASTPGDWLTDVEGYTHSSGNFSETSYSLKVINSCDSDYGDIKIDFYEGNNKRYQLLAPPAFYMNMEGTDVRISGYWNESLMFELQPKKTIFVWANQNSNSFDLPTHRCIFSQSEKLMQNGLRVKVKVKWGLFSDNPEIIVSPY